MELNTYPIFQELFSRDISIANIFLDPNNPRFLSMEWDFIVDDRISDPSIQKEIELKLIHEFGVNRLVMNMEINGYLPIDRVIVREFRDDQFVVLEGNRRICAAKQLKRNFEENPSLFDSEEIFESVKTIPCLVYTGSNQQASWIFQGLRHIMDVEDWSAFNKARLLVTLMDEEELNLTQVGKRFGLTAFGAGQ